MRKVLVGLVALVLALGACTDGDSSGESSGGGSGGGAGQGPSAPGEFSVLAMLGQVPAGVEHQIEIGDISRALELANAERADGLDPDSILTWFGPISGGLTNEDELVVFVPIAPELGRDAVNRIQEFHDELGWSMSDVDWFVAAGEAPSRFAVVGGGFGDEALAGLPEVTDGIVTAGEGDDQATDPDTRTAARPLGTPLRLARVDNRIALSGVTELVRAWLAGGSTLADDPELADVARALDSADVVGAYIYRGETSGQDRADVVGLGWGVDGETPMATVVYRFAESAPVDALRSAWEFEVEGDPGLELAEVTGDGATAVVSLRVVDGPPGRLMSMFYMRLIPFLA